MPSYVRGRPIESELESALHDVEGALPDVPDHQRSDVGISPGAVDCWSENVNPGRDGTTTSWPRSASRWASGTISAKVLGQPFVVTIGSPVGAPARTWTKWLAAR